MTFLKAFLTELRSRVFSPCFAVMTVIAALSYLISSVEEMKFAWNYRGADVLYFRDLSQNIGFFTPISILCCTALNCTSFLNDYRSEYYRNAVLRSGKRNYTLSKFLSCVITGGLTLALGLVMFILIVRMRFPLIAEDSSYLELYIRDADDRKRIFTSVLLKEGYYVGFFAVQTFLAFLFGALWSAVGICMSALITDRYVASFSPYIIWYVSRGILSGRFKTETVFNGDYNVGGVGGSLLWAVGYFGIIIAAAGIIFCRRAGKRCEV